MSQRSQQHSGYIKFLNLNKYFVQLGADLPPASGFQIFYLVTRMSDDENDHAKSKQAQSDVTQYV